MKDDWNGLFIFLCEMWLTLKYILRDRDRDRAFYAFYAFYAWWIYFLQ